MDPLLVSEMFILFNSDKLDLRWRIVEHRIGYGLAGAILMDLVLHKKIEVNGNKINIIDTSSTGDPFLDEAIAVLTQLKNNRRVRHNITQLVNAGENVFNLFAYRLEHLNLGKVLAITNYRYIRRNFPKFTFEYVNDEVRESIIKNLREVLLENKVVPNKALWYLISLLGATNGSKHIFGKEHKHQVRSKIKEIIINEQIGKIVGRKISEIESSS